MNFFSLPSNLILSLELVEVEVDVVTIEEVVVCSLELVLEDDWLGAEQATNKRAPNAINIKDFLFLMGLL